MSEAVTMSKKWDVAALLLGGFVTLAGVMHFVNPDFFDDIVPPWLPPSERFWTHLSGVAELVVGPMLLVPRTRRLGGIGAMVLLVAVYPANLYMAWDWRDRPFGDQLIAYGRLPFQFLFVWLAWQVARPDQPPTGSTLSTAPSPPTSTSS